jgi:streptomycin 6-kinase
MTRRFSVHLSEQLRHVIDELGDPAHRWLDALPDHLAEVADAWDLQLHDQLDHVGWCSVVYPATTTDGQAAILKATVPHDDAEGEASALRRWDGEVAARLLRASDDGFTLLLERCVPGHDLWTLAVDDQVEVAARLLPRLWREPHPGDGFRELTDTLVQWERRMREQPATFEVPPDVVARAARRTAAFIDEPGPRVLLHGDLNPGNVLAAQRAPWLAIDPKPWIGDPAFDLAQMLLNWAWSSEWASLDHAVERLASLAGRFARLLGLDPARVLRWAAVKAVGWEGERDQAVLLDATARSVIADR